MRKISLRHHVFLHALPTLIIATWPFALGLTPLPFWSTLLLPVLVSAYVFYEMHFAFLPSYEPRLADSATYKWRHRLPYVIHLATVFGIAGFLAAKLVMLVSGSASPHALVAILYGAVAAYFGAWIFQHSFAPRLRQSKLSQRI